jgi:hypothetical protein
VTLVDWTAIRPCGRSAELSTHTPECHVGKAAVIGAGFCPVAFITNSKSGENPPHRNSLSRFNGPAFDRAYHSPATYPRAAAPRWEFQLFECLSLADRRPTTDRLEPGTTHVEYPHVALRCPTYLENSHANHTWHPPSHKPPIFKVRNCLPRGFDSHRPLHFSLPGVSLRCPRSRLSLSPSSHKSRRAYSSFYGKSNLGIEGKYGRYRSGEKIHLL